MLFSFLLQFNNVNASDKESFSRYCDQLGGTITESKEISTLNEFSKKSCFEFICTTKNELKTLAGVPGENVTFSRDSESEVSFKLCQDKNEFKKTDLKIHFSYSDFEKSEGQITTFTLEKDSPCFRTCNPKSDDSYDYLCKHCIRANYFSSINDVNFVLASYVDGNECLKNYSVKECENSRTPAFVQKDPMIIEDKIELLLCDIKEEKKKIVCNGSDYVISDESLKAYFIRVPQKFTVDEVFIEDDNAPRTQLRMFCTNTGKTPFDNSYQHVSCYDGNVYSLVKDEEQRNLEDSGLDNSRGNDFEQGKGNNGPESPQKVREN